jgi:drug/metabolite transporter (DMT)-like permease
VKRFLVEHPALLIATFTLVWAVLEIIAPASGVSLYQVVWTRYGVHLAFMALLFAPRRDLGLLRPARPAAAVFTSLLMLGMPLCFIWGIQVMPVHNVMAVFWLAPLLVVAFARGRTGQAGGVRAAGASAVGLVGALLICKPDAGMFAPATVLGVGMAMCFALYIVMIGTMTHDALPTKLFHQALWVFVSLTLALPLFWETPTARGLATMTVIGVLGYGALYALDLALESAAAALLAPVLYTQLAWDLSLRVLLRDYLPMARPDWATVTGAVLVLTAALPALGLRAERRAAGAARP